MKNIRNLVVFGPAESGKSTLTGYLYYYSKKATYNLKRFNENVEKDLGSKYDPSSKFAYLVDRTREERTRLNAKKSGSSKHMHAIEINLENFENEFYVLDTPAVRHRTETKPREYIKGISFADIGIFMIDIDTIKDFQSKLLDPKKKRILLETLTPLNIWLTYKKRDRLIVVISKIDKVHFLQKDFDEAVRYIESIFQPISDLAIPISIDVSKEIDNNVLSKSDKLSWFKGNKGDTLLEILEKMDVSFDLPQSDNKQLFMSVYKEQKLSGIGKLFRGKVLQGTLTNSSKIKISPLRYLNSELSDVYADVAGIYNVDRKQIDSATPGDIVSVNIKNPNIYGNHVDKKDLFSEKSTCIYDAKMPTKKGDVLQFEIKTKELNKTISKGFDIQNTSLSRQLMLIWFGKTVPCKVLHRTIENQRIILTLSVMNKLTLSVPLDESENFSYNIFLFEVDKTTYFEAVLIGIESLDESVISIEDEDENYITELHSYFNNYSAIKNKNELIFKTIDIVKLLSYMSNIEKSLYIDKKKIKVKVAH